MKILLINPPRSPHNAILDHAPVDALRFIHRKLPGPPLGLLTVAAAVKNSHELSFLDLKGELDLNPELSYIEIVQKWCTRFDPDIVGVTFIASEYPYGMEIFRTVKKINSLVITVAGGLHATLCPHHFDNSFVDIVCPGQSAHTFARVADLLGRQESLDQVEGIMVRKGGHLELSNIEIPPCNAAGDQFLMPDRSLLDRWKDTYRAGSGPGPVTYLFTSLGCPYKCTFCSIWPQFEGQYHQRSVQSIIEELKGIKGYPVIRFADANTLVDVKFAEELFERIAAEGISKEYVMDIRVDTAADNPLLIEKLARGGLKVAISGFESFRDKELSLYNKNSSSSKIEKAIKVFHDNGVMVRGNYVIAPEYSEKDFAELGQFAEAHKVSFAGYTILSPMPGTEFYRKVYDRIVDHDLAKYNFFNCVLRTKLPVETFYEQVGKLWKIKQGTQTI